MNTEETGTGSPVHEQQARKERAAIAAQACETCRSRKTKCDEQRPRCGLCVRLGVDCKYREPQPTKKDKTLVHILDSLRRLEGKIDSWVDSGIQYSPSPASPTGRVWLNNFQSLHRPQSLPAQSPASQKSRLKEAVGTSSLSPYRHVTAAHKLLLWPAIRDVLEEAGITAAEDLKPLQRDGTQWLVKTLQWETNRTGLPNNLRLDSRPFAGMQTTRSGPRVIFTELTKDDMLNLSNVFFNTFNFIYPLLDQETFYTQTLTKVTSEGFGQGDTESVLALLVMALGQCALDGSIGASIEDELGRQSGIRGGTTTMPPGLDLFNEARIRMGFLMTQCDLESIQIFSLAAIYFGQCARYMDLWRMAVTAAMACKILVSTGEPVGWSTRRGDHIKRAFWHCVLIENGLTLELDLPPTGISDYEDLVPPPDFTGPYSSREMYEEEKSHFQYHFLAHVALKKLCSRVHSAIYDASGNGSEKSDDYGGPQASVIRELARQLDSWRDLLPTPLQWNDDNTLEMPQTDPHEAQDLPSLFMADHYSLPVTHSYSLDILVAVLRTRFYLTKYMIYRPFIYKALHYPEQMTSEDLENCHICLKSCLRWPLCMSPPKDKKRLLPYLFTWTQNFLGILLIFHMTTQSEILNYIRLNNLEPGELEETAGLMLDWIRDMKKVDGIAQWGWSILERLYPTEQL